MTNTPEDLDLSAIAFEAEAEIVTAETMRVAAVSQDTVATALRITEIDYYEAELRSLRDAASTLDEAEHHPG